MNANNNTTARLQLEPLVRAHAIELYEPLQDLRIYTYIPQDPPASLGALQSRYAFLEARASPDGTEQWLNWALRLRETGQPIGTIQATVMPDKVALIAYELLPEFWGCGYATEAVGWLLRELVAQWDVNEIRAELDTRNQPSIRLLERLGFEKVGFSAKADHFKGSDSDEFCYRWRP